MACLKGRGQVRLAKRRSLIPGAAQRHRGPVSSDGVVEICRLTVLVKSQRQRAAQIRAASGSERALWRCGGRGLSAQIDRGLQVLAAAGHRKRRRQRGTQLPREDGTQRMSRPGGRQGSTVTVGRRSEILDPAVTLTDAIWRASSLPKDVAQ